MDSGPIPSVLDCVLFWVEQHDNNVSKLLLNLKVMSKCVLNTVVILSTRDKIKPLVMYVWLIKCSRYNSTMTEIR